MSGDSGEARQRPVPSGRVERFGQFGRLAAGVAGGMIAEGARRLAAGGGGAIDGYGERVDAMIDIILGELHRPGAFNFGDRRFVDGLRDNGLAIASDKASWHIPPADLLFVQRKISGTALLAARLEARVDIRALARDALG